MARQLAALPKKQFELYRTKPTSLVARQILTHPVSTLKFTSQNLDMNETKSTDIKLKDMVLNMAVNSNEETVTSAVPTKKKSKKKKKKSSTASDQTTSVDNVEITDSGVIIENKLLDLGESGSRIVTMNKSMVADISAGVLDFKHSGKQPMEQDNPESNTKNNAQGNIGESIEKKNEQMDPKTPDFSEELPRLSSPPFGYPLSTDKLIQSAIELLSCEPSNDLYKIDKSATNKQHESEPQESNKSSNVSTNSPVDTPVSKNESLKDLTTSPDRVDLKGDESIDGDISNLSAWDDEEGWQSTRRSHRKRKKDFQVREKSNNSKGKKDNPKDSKQNSNRTQNPKSSHNRNHSSKNIFSPGSFSSPAQTHEVEKTEKSKKKSDNSDGIIATVVEKQEEEKSCNNTGAVFSYRDALLKTKSKPTEELQYNSDSGVDVNSVGSCDSAIHSPKPTNEFDLEEAVNFLMKGWNEVKELHKKGLVVYHKDVEDPVAAKKKNTRKGGWHAKHRNHFK